MFLKKLKLELPEDPAVPLLGMYPEEMKSTCQGDSLTLMFTAVLFTIAECGVNLNVHQWTNGYEYGIDRQWDIFFNNNA
jgi:hypothetical protein